MKINSNFIKLRLLEYYRFKRAMLAGTEVNVARGIADVLAISMDLKRSYEIEVKTSIQDLKNDFKNKENKHSKMEDKHPYDMTPNYFIFAIPEDLLEKAVLYLKTKNDKYGIILVEDNGDIKTIKKPKLLNKSDNVKLRHYLDLRLNNQLITTLQKLEKLV